MAQAIGIMIGVYILASLAQMFDPKAPLTRFLIAGAFMVTALMLLALLSPAWWVAR